MSFLNANARTVRCHADSLRCSIENCKTRPVNGKQIYPIPTGPTRVLWLDVIRRHNQSPNFVLTDFVCSDHFSDDQKLPNGHLKGNSVPNVFPSSLLNKDSVPINCQFCNAVFRNRKELLVHDDTKHAKEHSEMKLEVQFATPDVPEEVFPCNRCVQLDEIRQCLRRRKANIQKTIEILEDLQKDDQPPIKLDVDMNSPLPA